MINLKYLDYKYIKQLKKGGYLEKLIKISKIWNKISKMWYYIERGLY